MTTLVARALDLPGGRGVHALRAQRDEPPADVADHRLGLLRAALLPALARLRARRLRRRGRHRRRSRSTTRPSSRPACWRRRRSTARSTTRRTSSGSSSYQKLYDAVLSTPLGPKDIAVGRDRVRALPRPALRGRLLHRDRRARPRRVVVGAARAAGDRLRRLRVRGRGRSLRSPTCAAGRTSTSSTSRSCRCSSSRRRSSRSRPIPDWLEVVIQATPLYHGVELLRSLTTGTVGWRAARQRRLPGRARPRRHLDREQARREAPAHLNRSSVTTNLWPSAQDLHSAWHLRRLWARGSLAVRPLPRLRHGLREAERRRDADAEPGLPRLRLRRLAADTEQAGSVAAWPLRRGSPAAPARANQADAAEVVVLRRPAAHLQPRALELGQRLLVDAGLGVDDVAGAVEARPLDRVDRLEPLVQDPGGDADERRPEPRAAGRADRERESRRRRARGSAPSCSAIRSPGASGSRTRSTSPSMLFSCRSRPGRKSPVPRPRLDVSTHARPVRVGRDEIRRVPVDGRPLERRRAARARAPSRRARAAAAAGRASPARPRARRASGTRVPAYATSTGSTQRAS